MTFTNVLESLTKRDSSYKCKQQIENRGIPSPNWAKQPLTGATNGHLGIAEEACCWAKHIPEQHDF